MKRLVVCCDGTWQNLTNLCPTNIVKLSQSVKRTADNGIPQIVFMVQELVLRIKRFWVVLLDWVLIKAYKMPINSSALITLMVMKSTCLALVVVHTQSEV
jgi:hypothetical protein